MDDGGRCQLVDVINDPQLLESFLENGAANNGENGSTSGNNSFNSYQATNSQSQSTPKVTKKATKVQSKLKATNSSVDGKNNKKKLEARQVDTVTSSDSFPVVTEHKEEKKNSKGGHKSLATPSAQTFSLQVPNNRPGIMLPQQLVQVSPTGQLQPVVSGLPGPMILSRPQGQPNAPLVQIIQTSNGQATQLISVPVQAGQVSGKTNSSQSARAANKQILPKPSSSPSSTPVTSLTAVTTGQQNPSMRPGVAGGLPQTVTLTSSHVNAAAPQLILGGQTSSLIQPGGAFILNPASLQTIGGQQLIFPNSGLGGVASPIQLTIRTQTPQPTVVSSSPTFHSNTPLISSGRAVAPQHTFVLQQSSPQSQAVLAPRSSQNLVFARNAAPVISNSTIIQNPTAPQFIQIQTPSGPILLPLAQGTGIQAPQIISQPQVGISTGNNTLVQNFNGTTLQSLLTANPAANDLSHVSANSSSHSLIITTPTVQTTTSKGNASKKNNSSKGVNLADLLKESGILENSPPTSPTDVKTENTATADFSETIQHSQPQPSPQQTVFMVPTGANQQPHNLVLTQSGIQTPGLNQLRLALTADGSMILQPAVPNVPTFNLQQTIQSISENPVDSAKSVEIVKDLVLASSQPSPDSTTPTLDATPQSTRNSLSDHLGSGGTSDSKSADKVAVENKGVIIPVSVTDMNQSQKQTIKTDPSSKNEVRVSCVPLTLSRPTNCDSQSSNVVVSVADTENKKMETTGVTTMGPVMQISLEDRAFLEGLEVQIKELSSLTSSTEQQKSQLRELQTLQNQINEAKKAKTQSTDSGNGVKMILSVPSVRVAGQDQAPVFQATHLIQTNTQNVNQQQPNVQLVNLLKPHAGITVTPGAQTSIRLLPSSVATSVPETPTFQLMGNQLITIGSPVKNQIQSVQTSVASTPKVSIDNTPVIQVVRYQTTPSNTVTPAPVSLTSTKVCDVALDQEKRKQKTLKFFNQQLLADQSAALKPDYKNPFKNLDDACKRLLRYHVLQSTTCPPSVLAKMDEDFETISRDLLIKKQLLLDRFRRCILRQSYRTESSELVMLHRLFVSDESSAMKIDKEVVAKGIPLDLPPPPRSWQNEMDRIDDVELETNRKRKLPFLDEDLSEHLSAVKKQPIEPLFDKESDEETEDDDEDSSDDDDDANPGDDMSEYLGPNDTENVDINSIYDEINYDPSLTSVDTRQSVNLNFCDRSGGMNYAQHSQTNWTMGYDRSHAVAGGVWPTRYPEREAAVAVESILTSEEDDESSLSVDLALSTLASQAGNNQDDDDDDEGDEDGDEDDDDEEDEDDEDEDEDDTGLVSSHSYTSAFGNESGMAQQQQHSTVSCDPQIQCAIDSILVDLPQQPPRQPFFSNDSYSRSYGSVASNMSVGHRAGLSTFGHSLQGQINDPALDEAVKSILS